jgi:hypothetical protein
LIEKPTSRGTGRKVFVCTKRSSTALFPGPNGGITGGSPGVEPYELLLKQIEFGPYFAAYTGAFFIEYLKSFLWESY